ncbi:hypothetical protein B0T18DRAFT_234076 [Schizothecium vesticola]|uniref:GPI anchored serine-rich protein n=1 Tax=Schizothecium vesticola TaxID=314040 RepID=A0AA40BP13_9PEZI|nr:hypothetical protein B0T18DRAFT_234076 [Schizothecium vesticola]
MRTTFFLAALPILAFAAPSKPADVVDIDDEDCSTTTTKAAAVTTKAPRPNKWKTSTVFSTTVHTVTSCAPTVTNCPGKPGKPVVVTEPVDSGCSTTTSTSTCVHTETTGPKDVVVTTYLPVTQTICPIPGKPTWAHPEPSVPAGPAHPGHPGKPEEVETPKPVAPGAPKPTGTGSWPAPTKPGQAVVTAGAAENMAALKMVGAAAFAALLL